MAIVPSLGAKAGSVMDCISHALYHDFWVPLQAGVHSHALNQANLSRKFRGHTAWSNRSVEIGLPGKVNQG